MERTGALPYACGQQGEEGRRLHRSDLRWTESQRRPHKAKQCMRSLWLPMSRSTVGVSIETVEALWTGAVVLTSSPFLVKYASRPSHEQ